MDCMLPKEIQDQIALLYRSQQLLLPIFLGLFYSIRQWTCNVYNCLRKHFRTVHVAQTDVRTQRHCGLRLLWQFYRPCLGFKSRPNRSMHRQPPWVYARIKRRQRLAPLFFWLPLPVSFVCWKRIITIKRKTLHSKKKLPKRQNNTEFWKSGENYFRLIFLFLWNYVPKLDNRGWNIYHDKDEFGCLVLRHEKGTQCKSAAVPATVRRTNASGCLCVNHWVYREDEASRMILSQETCRYSYQYTFRRKMV